jgi:drug/metabolite transporter (DMT)-like permease
MPEPSAGRGVLLSVAAALGFSVMNALVKLLAAEGIPFVEVAAARALFGGLLLYGLARARGIPLAIHDRRATWVRTLAGCGAMTCTFFALSSMPLADAAVLFNTTPLWVAMLGLVILREKIGRMVLVALLIAPIGVVLVLRPGDTFFANGLIALLASVLSAIAMVSLRRLGATETPEAVVVHFSLWAGAILTVATIPFFVMPTPLQLALLVGSGIFATAAQVAMTKAYALDRAARVGGAGYLGVVFSAAFGLLFFDEALAPTTLAGIALVLLAGTLLWRDARREGDVRAGG